MTPRALEIFVAVCDKMSMTEAAKSLFVSQSSVSHTIRQMEQECGVPLFLRQGTGLQLTRYGNRMLLYSKHVLEHLKNIREEVQSVDKPPRTIRIGCTPDISEHFVLDLLQEYQKQPDAHTVFVGSYYASQMEVFLLKHELDIAITEDVIDSENLELLPLFQDSMVYVCCENSRFISPRPAENSLPVVRRDELDNVPLYTHHRYIHTAVAPENQYPFIGLSLYNAGSFNGSGPVEQAVRKDLGVGLVSPLALQDAPDLIPFNIEGMQFERTIFLARDTSSFPPQEIEDFIEFVLDYVRTHIPKRQLLI